MKHLTLDDLTAEAVACSMEDAIDKASYNTAEEIDLFIGLLQAYKTLKFGAKKTPAKKQGAK
jgi:hypothetical protein